MSVSEKVSTTMAEFCEEFNQILDRSLQGINYFTVGERITTEVVSVSGSYVFIDIGGKREGFIDFSEFVDENGVASVKPGDRVEAFFSGTHDGMMKFTTLIKGRSINTIRFIEEKAMSGEPVEGTVSRSVKGGYEVMLKGVRCFCPQSQIDIKPVTDKSLYEGKTLQFKIIEHKGQAEGVVLSRRALLEEEKKRAIEELKNTVTEGSDIVGTVSSIKNFGVFVDIGGIEGLIPLSELGWTRVEKVEELFTPGQSLKVRVLSADFNTEKITLSLKALQRDPWIDADKKYPVGSRVNGRVIKLMPFGAFVLLDEGIEALIHISNLGVGRRIRHPEEVLKEGQGVEAYVLSVDPQNKRMSLSLNPKDSGELVYPSVGDIIEVSVLKTMPFGVLVKVDEAITGLIPNGETGINRLDEIKDFFTEGKLIKAIVKEVDTDKGRVRLSRKDYENKRETEEYRQYIKEQGTSKQDTGLSIGALIESKMTKTLSLL